MGLGSGNHGFVLAREWHRPRSIDLQLSTDPMRWTLERRAAWQRAALLPLDVNEHGRTMPETPLNLPLL